MANEQRWRTVDGQASARREGQLRVLHLSGTPVEMARQHGELLAEDARRGALGALTHLMEHHMLYGATRHPLVRRAAVTAVERLLLRPMGRHIPDELRRGLHALVDAAGLHHMDAEAIACVTDVAAAAATITSKLAGWAPHPHLGCTGFVAGPGATRDSHVIHGRNLDFDVVGTWDRFPVVAFCRPREGQRYVYVSTAGIPSAALTGLNESGLFVAESTLPTVELTLRAPPFLAVQETLVRECRTFEEALRRAAEDPQPGGYAIHISHGPSGRGAIVERTARRAAVRQIGEDDALPDAVLATNHFQDPVLAETEPGWHFVDRPHSLARAQRIREGLIERHGGLGPSAAALLLRDTVDPGVGLVRPAGDVVGNFLNVQSVVADMTAMQLWVAEGLSPCASSDYVGFDVMAELDGDGARPSTSPPPLPAARARGGRRHAAIRRQIDAYQAYRHIGRPDTALALVTEAAELDPDEPNYRLAEALLALQTGEPERTLEAVSAFRSAPNPQHRDGRARLAEAWAHDLLGHRADARAGYTKIRAEHAGDPWLLSHAERGLATPFDERHRRGYAVDLFHIRPYVP